MTKEQKPYDGIMQGIADEVEARKAAAAVDFGGLKTNPELLALLKRAAAHVMTPEELFEQRVSWAYSMQNFSDGEVLSRDSVRALLGQVAAPAPAAAVQVPVARMLIDETVRFILCEGTRERLGGGEHALYTHPLPPAEPVAREGWQMVPGVRNDLAALLLRLDLDERHQAHSISDLELGTVLRAAMLASAPPPLEGAPVAQPKVLDDPRLQELFSSAILGALAFGAQGTNEPPEGHWLTQFWQLARAERLNADLNRILTMPEAQLDAEIRAEGGDPDDYARRGGEAIDRAIVRAREAGAPVAQALREPLTEEEIRQAYDVAHGRGPNTVSSLSEFSIRVARAIEAALAARAALSHQPVGSAPAADLLVTLLISVDRTGGTKSDVQTHDNSYADVAVGLGLAKKEIERVFKEREQCPYYPSSPAEAHTKIIRSQPVGSVMPADADVLGASPCGGPGSTLQPPAAASAAIPGAGGDLSTLREALQFLLDSEAHGWDLVPAHDKARAALASAPPDRTATERKPLTDEQIDDAWRTRAACWNWSPHETFTFGVRIAESIHGIDAVNTGPAVTPSAGENGQ